MLQARPDIIRRLVGQLKEELKDVRHLDVYRRNGVEAFTDLETLNEVIRLAGAFDREVIASIRAMRREPGTRLTDARFDLAVSTVQPQEAYEALDGSRVLTLFRPLRNLHALPGLSRGRPRGPRRRPDQPGARPAGRRAAGRSQPSDRGRRPHDPRGRRRPGRLRGPRRPGALTSGVRRGPAAWRRGSRRARGRDEPGRDRPARRRDQRHGRPPRGGAPDPGGEERRAGDRAPEPQGVDAEGGAAGAGQGRAGQVRPRGGDAAPREAPRRPGAGEARGRRLRPLPRRRGLHASLRAAPDPAAQPDDPGLLLELPRDHPSAPRRRQRDGGGRPHGDLPERGGGRAPRPERRRDGVPAPGPGGGAERGVHRDLPAGRDPHRDQQRSGPRRRDQARRRWRRALDLHRDRPHDQSRGPRRRAHHREARSRSAPRRPIGSGPTTCWRTPESTNSRTSRRRSGSSGWCRRESTARSRGSGDASDARPPTDREERRRSRRTNLARALPWTEVPGQVHPGHAAPVWAQRRTSSWNSRCPIVGGVRAPGLHAHRTSGSVVTCSTRAWTARPAFVRGPFNARQRSASDRSSHPMLRGASCQRGAPGTRPSAVFSV